MTKRSRKHRIRRSYTTPTHTSTDDSFSIPMPSFDWGSSGGDYGSSSGGSDYSGGGGDFGGGGAGGDW